MKIKLFCMNPANPLQKMGKGYRTKVFFSATLSPLLYYKDTLGGKEDDYILSIPTPFSSEQVEVFIKPLPGPRAHKGSDCFIRTIIA